MRGLRLAFLMTAVAGLTVVSANGTTAAGRPVSTGRGPGVVPFVAGHVRSLGRLKSPPTIAQCEQYLGTACYQAFQIEHAYDLSPLFSRGITGRGETIVVVDAFGSPTIQSDLDTFDAQMGLPNPPSFKIITPEGPITTTPSNCTSSYNASGPDLCSDYYSWTDETSHDVEWSHAMAPGANILLVETPVTETEGTYGFSQLVDAENYVVANHLGNVITQSFGASESTFSSPSQIDSLRSAYVAAAQDGVTVLASSGDLGATDDVCNPSADCADPDDVVCCNAGQDIDWPASDPLVTAVGGTELRLGNQGNRLAPDTVWDDLSSTLGYPGPTYTTGASGGGLSTVFSRPSFQDGVSGVVGAARGTPDISMSASVSGAVEIWDTTDPSINGWGIIGGTSEASPLFAGIVALADQMAGRPLGYINPALYAMAASGQPDGIVPVTQGTNTFDYCPTADVDGDGACASASDVVDVSGFTAGDGYNDATGLGTVDAAAFVPALVTAAGGPSALVRLLNPFRR